MSHDSSHATILIRRSTTRGLPVEDGTGKSLIQVSEIAYSLLADTNDDGLGNGGDRLYIGAGNILYEPDVNSQGDSVSHYYSSEIHTIGGKYFTDMMNHQRGIVTAASSLLVDDDKKLNELLVDFLYFNKDSVSTEATNDLVLRGGTGLTKVTGDLQVTQNVQIDGTLTVDGIATLKAGTSGTITVGDQNTDNVVFGADINSSLIPNITDTYDLGTALQRWRTLHVRQAILDSATFDILQINEDLNVDGLTTLDSTTIDPLLIINGSTGPTFNDRGLIFRPEGNPGSEIRLQELTEGGSISLVTYNKSLEFRSGGIQSTRARLELSQGGAIELGTQTANQKVVLYSDDDNGAIEFRNGGPSFPLLATFDSASATFKQNVQVDVDFNVDGLTTLDSTTIDGDLIVNRNLFVYGEQTNISTTELLVEDQQIVIANGTPTAVLANGAGIAIGDSASPYAYARYANNGVDSARWEFSPKIYAQSLEFEVIDCGTYA
jgi:cytoskeletal protein CcmA (bactofilin family)